MGVLIGGDAINELMRTGLNMDMYDSTELYVDAIASIEEGRLFSNRRVTMYYFWTFTDANER